MMDEEQLEEKELEVTEEAPRGDNAEELRSRTVSCRETLQSKLQLIEKEIESLSGIKNELSEMREELQDLEKLLQKELGSEEVSEIKGSVELLEEEIESKTSCLDKSELADEYLRRLQYLQADFQNYRKRVNKEKEEIGQYVKECLIIRLLDVIDDFERALISMKDAEDVSSVADGVEMIMKHLQSLLESEGVTPINCVGECFDPYKHEAVVCVPTDEYEENTVIEEIKKGYQSSDKVIRPAMVKVAKK